MVGVQRPSSKSKGHTMITQDQHSIAVSSWRLYFGEVDYVKFLKFVGEDTDQTPHETYYTYSDEKERRLNLLAGPHWFAIIKAYEALHANG